MIDTDKLRKAAMAVAEWGRCMKDSFESEYGEWAIGHIDEDGNKAPVMLVDAGEYEREFDNKPLADYYAQANPAAILELLDEHARLAEFASAVFCEANHAYASSEDESMVLRNLQDCGLLDSTGQPVGEWHKAGVEVKNTQ